MKFTSEVNVFVITILHFCSRNRDLFKMQCFTPCIWVQKIKDFGKRGFFDGGAWMQLNYLFPSTVLKFGLHFKLIQASIERCVCSRFHWPCWQIYEETTVSKAQELYWEQVDEMTPVWNWKEMSFGTLFIVYEDFQEFKGAQEKIFQAHCELDCIQKRFT